MGKFITYFTFLKNILRITKLFKLILKRNKAFKKFENNTHKTPIKISKIVILAIIFKYTILSAAQTELEK